jgi:ATP-dependent RNA helicase DeaD
MPAERQTALFSATLPPRIADIANKHLKDPVRVRIDREVVPAGSAPRVRQVAYIVARAHKMATLGRIIDVENPTSAIVFCRTRTEVDEVTETLNGRGYRAEALHGGLSQEQRDRVMKKFRANTTDLLVATDVAARGLDVQHVSHVVNYDVPSAAEAYVHRIGRTGRAGREGVAITLAEPREHRLLRNIEYQTKQKIEIAAVPTVADLRARRLEMTRASLRETIIAGGLDQFRVLVDSLAQEFDIMDVAAAAVKQADAKEGTGDAEEIPAVTIRTERPSRNDRERAPTAKAGSRRHEAAKAGARSAGGKRERITPEWDVARLYIGAGRQAKVRPSDLVGAIVNEAGVDPRAIGAIQITERFSLVEVPDEIADGIIDTLRGATIKGKRVPVRRDREQGGAG